jgi:hypothetical protein
VLRCVCNINLHITKSLSIRVITHYFCDCPGNNNNQVSNRRNGVDTLTQLMDKAFGKENIDKPATIVSAKSFLNEYEFWHLQELQLDQIHRLGYRTLPTLQMPSERAAQVKLECQLRLQTIETLHNDTEDIAFLADILRLRYINAYTVPKTCSKLLISERTFDRYQNDALFAFALACPFNLIVYINHKM